MEQVGLVKWFDEAKGYGFITPAGGGPDIFVHYSNIKAQGFKTLVKGQQVRFEPFVGPKGPSALSVEITQDVAGSKTNRQPRSTPADNRDDYDRSLDDVSDDIDRN
jgi:CspA family cold shock protein